MKAKVDEVVEAWRANPVVYEAAALEMGYLPLLELEDDLGDDEVAAPGE